jgi:hypothetical protein
MDIVEKYKNVRVPRDYVLMNFKYLYFGGSPVVDEEKYQIVSTINKGREMVDFDLLIFIRYIYLSKNFKYLSMLRPNLDLWLWRKFDRPTVQCFWTENHMMAYLSTSLLLLESSDYYSNPLLTKYSDRLMDCLQTWLDTRTECGFTEYCSSVYLPYTLEGLLNIVDFSSSHSMKKQATFLVNKILDWFMTGFPTDSSTHIAQSRMYSWFIDDPENQNICDVIRVLRGQDPISLNSRLLANLLTSKYFLSYLKKKPSQLNIIRMDTYKNNFQDFIRILNRYNLYDEDKTMFLWGNGMFFNTYNSLATARALSKYNLWEHKHFQSFKILQNLYYLIPILAYLVKPIANAGQYLSVKYHTHSLYEHHITFIETNKMYCGIQQFPFFMRIYDESIWFLAANSPNFKDHALSNTRIPRITYDIDNDVYNIRYRPNRLTPFLGRRVYIKLLQDSYIPPEEPRTIKGYKKSTIVEMIFSTDFILDDENDFAIVDAMYFNVRIKFLY